MKTIVRVLVAVGVSVACALSGAQASDLPVKAPEPAAAPLMPASAFFVGAGASYTSTSYQRQNLYAQGVSVIYQDELIGYGSAGGSTNPGFSSDSGFAPVIQLGYFQHFGESDWLWGAKFTYNHVGASATSEHIPVPQEGPFTNVSSQEPTGSFTGNVLVGSYESKITHQMSFVPFIGRSFERSFLYAGAGPSLSRAEASLDRVTGFADINGVHYDITGLPSNFSSSDWVFGGVATAGITYFLNASWFLDLNYTYAMTEKTTNSYSTPFSSTADGYNDLGILSGNYSGRTVTQAVAISINTAF